LKFEHLVTQLFLKVTTQINRLELLFPVV